MSKTMSVGTKIIILIAFAVLFGAAMIAFSVRTKTGNVCDNWSSIDADKKYEQTFNVQPDGKLIIDADIGNISVTGGDVHEVSVQIYVEGSDEQIKKYNIKFDQDGNTVKIKGNYKRRHINLFQTDWLDVQFDIKIPNNFNLDIQTSGGNITVTNVNGNINGETSGGNIEILNVDGDIRMETSGGNVVVKQASGKLFLETSGGNIELKNIDGKLNASTSGGNIYASAISNMGIDLSTSGGNITVELPKTITADVRAETSGGDVSCDLEFSGKIKDGSMKGKIGGGGNMIRLETSGGDIVITPLE
ncbi:MAG: DUF4097 family beta strand repeat-containing protein [Bacteroidota bacterium]|nr:DUF4097 family beta strand repeat-containing protein [Bacteroidota bacterium]